MKRFGFIAVIVVVAIFACVGLFAAIFLFSIGATQVVADTGDAFLTALKDGDYAAAYNLSSVPLQSELRSADQIRVMVVESRSIPESWSFTSRSINNNQGQVSGTVTYQDGRQGAVTMTFINDGTNWKVSGFNLQ